MKNDTPEAWEKMKWHHDAYWGREKPPLDLEKRVRGTGWNETMTPTEARMLFAERRAEFYGQHGYLPTRFVIRHALWLTLTEPFRQGMTVKCDPPESGCPKFEGMDAYRTVDGPDDLLIFF